MYAENPFSKAIEYHGHEICFSDDTGSADAIVGTPNPPWKLYGKGVDIFIKVIANNTGPMTISVSGLSATAVKLPSGDDPSAGDVSAEGIYHFIFDGTNFQVINPDHSFFAGA